MPLVVLGTLLVVLSRLLTAGSPAAVSTRVDGHGFLFEIS